MGAADGSTIQPLAERLRKERLLLVLDNVEQVVDATPLFVGGCALDAVAEICAPDIPLDPLDGVGALVEQSLLRRDDNADEPRVGMLETIRDYAWERLVGEGEESATRRAHALHYLAVAEAAEPALHDPTAGAWLTRLEREHDNLRAALDWAWEEDQLTLALRLAGALWWFWHIRGHLSEGRGWLERLLTADAAAPRSAPTAVRVKALVGAGWLAHYHYDYGRAAELFAEGTAMEPFVTLPLLALGAGDRRAHSKRDIHAARDIALAASEARMSAQPLAHRRAKHGVEAIRTGGQQHEQHAKHENLPRRRSSGGHNKLGQESVEEEGCLGVKQIHQEALHTQLGVASGHLSRPLLVPVSR